MSESVGLKRGRAWSAVDLQAAPAKPKARSGAIASRRIEHTEKKEAILIRAASLFNSKGYGATSVEDIADSLGVTKPVIYYYFKNKEDLLVGCIRKGLTELMKISDRMNDTERTGVESLHYYITSYAEIIMTEFGRCAALTTDDLLSPQGLRRFKSLQRKIDDSLRAFVENARADGSAVVEDVWLTSFAFAGALNWTSHWYDPRGARTRSELAVQLADILIRSIRK